MPPFRCAAALLVVAALSAADDEAPPPGMDLVPLIKAAAAQVTAPADPMPGRPWSDDLAALTDPSPAVNGPAIGRLVRRGPIVLTDLGVMADDRDWQLRTRIVRVAAGIGGEAGAELTLRLSRDADARVRRLATVGLGRCRGEAVLTRLLELLGSLDGDERAAAAPSLSALGDVRAIAPLTRLRSDPDAPARSAQVTALRELCSLESAAPVVAGLLGEAVGEQRRALLEALDGSSDTRLCPALAKLVDDREALTALLAVRALGTAGDARAVAPLVRLTTSERLSELREAAAATLRVLTPYRAGPGPAWTLWWKDNAARWQRLAERDLLIAQLLDTTQPIPTGLANFPPEDLAPLVEAAIVARNVPAWLPARALAALRQQGGTRWIQPLASAIDQTIDGERRLDLLLLLDEIGGPEAKGEFGRQREELLKRDRIAMERWEASQTVPPDTGAEHALIQMALGRR
jgi:HEAT repeat protein